MNRCRRCPAAPISCGTRWPPSSTTSARSRRSSSSCATASWPCSALPRWTTRPARGTAARGRPRQRRDHRAGGRGAPGPAVRRAGAAARPAAADRGGAAAGRGAARVARRGLRPAGPVSASAPSSWPPAGVAVRVRVDRDDARRTSRPSWRRTAVVTSNGGLASHAAVVARGAGKPAVCGATELALDRERGHGHRRRAHAPRRRPVSVDGRSGAIYVGALDIRPAEPPAELGTSSAWADEVRQLGVRTNADTALETRLAIASAPRASACAAPSTSSSATGCRWSGSFLSPRTQRGRPAARSTGADRRPARGLHRAARGRWATARSPCGCWTRRCTSSSRTTALRRPRPRRRRAAELREANPMLGLRGVRLALVNEELYPAQAEALFSAWVDVAAEGIKPSLEVMIPLVSLPRSWCWRSGRSTGPPTAWSARPASGPVPRRQHGRDPAGGALADASPSTPVPVLRHQRPDPADLRLLPGRRREAGCWRTTWRGPALGTARSRSSTPTAWAPSSRSPSRRRGR